MSARAFAPGRPSLLAIAAALLSAAGLAAGATAPAAAETCSNEDRRIEQGALALPDCRAYELVTGGSILSNDARPGRAATGGGALTYYTGHPAPDAETSAYFYLTRRGAGGWSYAPVGPQNAAASRYDDICDQNVFFSPDLSENVLEAGWFDAYPPPPKCKHTEEPVVAGEPIPYRNVFVHDIATGSYQLTNAPPEGATPENAAFQDASDDFSHIVFGEEAKLTPEAPAGYNLYLWNDGTIRLVTFLPDGTPAAGEIVEATGRAGAPPSSGFAPLTGATSTDGQRIFFYSGGKLYLRENADQPQSAVAGGACTEPARACTVEIDESHGPGGGGGGVFWRATSSGSSVFFTAASKLTPDSTAEAGKPDLYRYDVGSGQLTDLTVHAGEAAGVRGVSGMSEDGSYLYFVANGALAPGATPGDCPGTAVPPGHCNLYVLHGGSIAFVGKLSRMDSYVWQEDPGALPGPLKSSALRANVSPNGRFLAFVSYEKLTGYDNTDANLNVADREIFLYDAAANGGSGQLSCASCPPGAPEDPAITLATAGNYAEYPPFRASWMVRSVLDDGSVLFNSSDALLAEDTNASEDVYAYRDGVVSLISPGDSPGRARFLDASPDGTDVFFRTPQALVDQDTDNENLSLYDARVDGGFANVPPATPCEAEACREAIEPQPILPTPVNAGAHPNPKPPCRRRAKKGRRCHRGAHHKHRGRHRDTR